MGVLAAAVAAARSDGRSLTPSRSQQPSCVLVKPSQISNRMPMWCSMAYCTSRACSSQCCFMSGGGVNSTSRASLMRSALPAAGPSTAPVSPLVAFLRRILA